jgi:hypothetical protein
MVKLTLNSVSQLKQLVREVQILRMLNEIDSNGFIIKLLDVHLPEYAARNICKLDTLFLVTEFVERDL